MPKARLVFDGDNVYIGKDARIYGLKDDIATKIDGIPGVIDNLSSTSTTDALSANMGRDLQDQINSMSGIGTFLSTWDCTTGLPGTNPQQDPYTYKVGDYYIVSEVGATNYKPHGGTFTQGVPSTTVETENVGINDKYYFDGADWVRIPNTAIQITIDTALSTSSTNAVENRAIATAINAKQDAISDLSTIRTGASKGATALQPNDNISQLANNVGYQTAGDVASAIAGKQDTLTAGDGISLLNNIVTNTKPGTAVSSTAPSNPTEGMLWYDTINHVLKIYNGTDWETVDTDSDTTYTAGNGINISAQNEISVDTTVIATKQYVDEKIYSGGTAPQNPQEGDLWYDTVNDKLMVYDGTNWVEVGSDAADINTKTFYLSSTSDLTNAQAAYDWYAAGKNPIIVYNNKAHIIKYVDVEKLQFGPTAFHSNLISNSTNSVTQDIININFSAGVVTSISTSSFGLTGNFLRTDYNYSSPYTPAYDGSPATKKYVDDKMFSGSISPSNPTTGQLRYDTTNNILMVYDGSNWVEVGNDMISDAAYSSSWDGDTTHSPSKNAIYDVLGDINTLLANI